MSEHIHKFGYVLKSTSAYDTKTRTAKFGQSDADMDISGEAPVFGIRAFVNFDARYQDDGETAAADGQNVLIRARGNVDHVERISIYAYKIYFIKYMPSWNYVINSTVGSGELKTFVPDEDIKLKVSVTVKSNASDSVLANAQRTDRHCVIYLTTENQTSGVQALLGANPPSDVQISIVSN
jgi:hypothetical protein